MLKAEMLKRQATGVWGAVTVSLLKSSRKVKQAFLPVFYDP